MTTNPACTTAAALLATAAQRLMPDEIDGTVAAIVT